MNSPLDFIMMWLIIKRRVQLRLRPAPLLTAFLWLASFWIGIGLAYAVPTIKQKNGEMVHSILRVEHGETLFSKPRTSEIPLPAGDWRIRVIDDTYSTHQNKVKGLRIWLESVVNMRIEQFAVFDIYEAEAMNWNEGNRCQFLISSPRGSAISGGCYGLSRTEFMSDPKSDIQKKIRAEWLQEGIQASRQRLVLRGYADRRTGLVVYFEVGTIFPNTEKGRIDLLLERLRNGSALQSNEQLLVNWYRNYGQSILNAVVADKASTSSQLLAESPYTIYYDNQQNKQQQGGDSIRLAEERLETNKRRAGEVNEKLGQEKLSEAVRLAEEKNLAEEKRLAEERK